MNNVLTYNVDDIANFVSRSISLQQSIYGIISYLEEIVVVADPLVGMSVRNEQQLTVTVERYVGEYFVVDAVDIS